MRVTSTSQSKFKVTLHVKTLFRRFQLYFVINMMLLFIPSSAFQGLLNNINLSVTFQLLYFEQDTSGGYGLALQVMCILL